MKNHIVAPIALARNWCLNPGKCGWNPDAFADNWISFCERGKGNATYVHTCGTGHMIARCLLCLLFGYVYLVLFDCASHIPRIKRRVAMQNEQRRKQEIAIITYQAPGRTFDRLFKGNLAIC